MTRNNRKPRQWWVLVSASGKAAIYPTRFQALDANKSVYSGAGQVVLVSEDLGKGPARVSIGSGTVVNVKEEGNLKTTPLAKALDVVVTPIIRFLLKVSPGTVVLANVDLTGPFYAGIYVQNSQGVTLQSVGLWQK